jgi:sugar phosphate isomerase/epimerase
MKICGVMDLPLVGLDQLGKNLEYYAKSIDAIEIMLDYPLDPASITKKQAKSIKDTLASYDFNTVLHAPWVFTNLLVPSQRLFDLFLEEIKVTSKIARTLDSKLVTVHLGNYSIYQKKEIDQLISRAIRGLEKISDHDSIIISVENMDVRNGFRRGFPLAAPEIETVCDSDLKITLDTGHAFLMGENPLEIFSKFKDKIAHIHLHDSTKEEAHLALGQGSFDYQKFVKEVIKSGYSGYACLEVITRENFESSLMKLRKIGIANL